MDQIKILKRAFQISWRYRALWLIGLLLVLAGGGVTGFGRGGPAGGGGAPQVSGGGKEWRGTPDQWSEAWRVIAPILVAVGAILLVLALFVVLVGIGRVVLRYLTRVSLIRMVDQYEETGEELSVTSGLRLGWSGASFQLFLVSLIIKLPIALLMIALIVPVVTLAVLLGLSESSGASSGVGVILGVILILTLVPIILLGVALSIIVGPWTQVAHRACAIDGLGALSGVRSAFGLIRRNLGPTALQWLLLVGLGVAWRIALIPANVLLVGLAFLIGGIPAALVGGIGGLIGGWPWGLGAGLFVFAPLFILAVALPNLALSTAAAVYHSTAWTLTYRELKVIDAAEVN